MPKQKKIWVKAECWVTKAELEVAQSAFVEAMAIGMEIDDGELPEGKRKFADDRIALTAYFEAGDVAPDEIKNTVIRFFSECELAMPEIIFSDFLEEDWQANFVKTCTTFKIEPDIFIVPSFEIDEFKKNPRGDLYIEMDPENAFGTGQHQTTKLCLTALRNMRDFSGSACLDVGTGSGILAILIKKLGAQSMLATETDADALETAERNAQKNGVGFDTLVVSEDHRYEKEAFDLVVANILVPVLIIMADNLAATLRPQARLILSGILVPQAAGVIAAYEACGLNFVRQDVMDDWCALLFVRN